MFFGENANSAIPKGNIEFLKKVPIFGYVVFEWPQSGIG